MRVIVSLANTIQPQLDFNIVQIEWHINSVNGDIMQFENG